MAHPHQCRSGNKQRHKQYSGIHDIGRGISGLTSWRLAGGKQSTKDDHPHGTETDDVRRNTGQKEPHARMGAPEEQQNRGRPQDQRDCQWRGGLEAPQAVARAEPCRDQDLAVDSYPPGSLTSDQRAPASVVRNSTCGCGCD